MTPEGKVKAKIKDMLKEAGAWYFMPFMAGMGTGGVPDFIACHNGKLLAIEAKAHPNKPTALQYRALVAIDKAGGIAIWVDELTLYKLEEVLHDHRTEQAGSSHQG